MLHLETEDKRPSPCRVHTSGCKAPGSIKTLGFPPYQEGMDQVIFFSLALLQNYLIHSTNTYWGPTAC